MSNTLTTEDWSRHHRIAAGVDVVDAMWIDGYEQQSVWGYDTATGSFFAQLWPNGHRSDEPELWLTPPTGHYPQPQMLVPYLVEHTGLDPLPIVRGMGLASPNPRVSDNGELDAYLDELWKRPPSALTNGEIEAATWMRKRDRHSPSSKSRTFGQADDEWHHEVDAEAVHATGITYLTRSDRAVGIETALVHAVRSM